MDWREKSVSLENVEVEEFHSDLADVMVSERRVVVIFERAPAWKDIDRRFGENAILKEARWEEVEDVTLHEETPFPHIALTVEGEEGTVTRNIFFREPEFHTMERCRDAIERHWNAARQADAPRDRGYSFREAEDVPDEEVDLGELVEEDELLADQEIAVEPEDEEEPDEDEEDVDDIVERFMEE